MKKNLLLFVSIIFIGLGITNAENKSIFPAFPGNSSIKGKIQDENGKPVEFVNIALHKNLDSSIVMGSISKSDGVFEITEVPKGEYYLKISCIGFTTKIIDKITITTESAKDLGSMKLNSIAIQMKEKTITAERMAEEFKADKKVINVSQNITAAGGTALDALQNQPSVQTDANGNVTLRGSSNFSVQINGRPSAVQGADALRQIPASQIDNIELITNPSSKYDAEGSAGIINIILKKQLENSFSGIWNAGGGTRDKYNSDFTFNYKSENISYFFGVDYRNTGFINTQNIERNTPAVTPTVINTSDLNMKMTRTNSSGKAGFEYAFDNGSVFGLNTSGGKFSFKGNIDTKIDVVSSGSNTIYNKDEDRRNLDSKYFNIAGYFTRPITPKVNEINFDLYFARVNMPSDQVTDEYLADAFYYPIYSSKVSNQLINNSNRTEGRFKLNYKFNYSSASTFETGIQTNLFYRTINLESNTMNTYGNWIPTPDYANDYDFRNNIYAGFINYSNEIFGINYQAGLRGEYTDRLLDQLTMYKKYEYRKFHLFPSVYFTYKISADKQLQANYSRRINRPPDQLLNPFPMFSSKYLVSMGNPNLQPDFTNSYELNYQKYFTGASFSLQTYFRQTLNGMNQSMSVEGEKMITTFINLSETRAIGSEISGSVTLAPWIKIDPAFNLFDNQIIGSLNTDENHHFSWFFRMNTNLFLSSSTRIMITNFYFAKNVMSLGEISSIFNWSIAIRQELFDRKLTLNLSAQNLIYQPEIKINTSGSNFKTYLSVKQEAPVIMLTASFNFNNFKANPKTQNNIDINPGNAF